MNIREVQAKVDVITDSLEKLHSLKGLKFEEFSSDFRNIDSALHRLQTSMQALLDMGSYIIVSMGFKTPSTNAEIVEILRDAGFIPNVKADTYIKMSQSRNRIVYLYNHIDTETLYDILIHELNDIKELFVILLEIIQSSVRDCLSTMEEYSWPV